MNHPQANLFEQFLRERTYLKNVTPSTLIWYRVAFKNYGAAFPDETLPTRVSLQQFVIGLRERHIKPVTCNTCVGAMNAYCRWLHEEGYAATSIKLQKLRVERRVLELLNEPQMRVLIGYRPKTYRETRLHVAVLLVMDTGLRISEALGLREYRAAFFSLRRRFSCGLKDEHHVARHGVAHRCQHGCYPQSWRRRGCPGRRRAIPERPRRYRSYASTT